MKVNEEKIRAHAYALWEQEGQPEGRHEEHWHQAEKHVAGMPDESDEDMHPEKKEASAETGTARKGKDDSSSAYKMSRKYKK